MSRISKENHVYHCLTSLLFTHAYNVAYTHFGEIIEIFKCLSVSYDSCINFFPRKLERMRNADIKLCNYKLYFVIMIFRSSRELI